MDMDWDTDLALELSVIAVCQFSASTSQVIAGLGGAMIFSVGWNLAGIVGWSSGKIIDIAVYLTVGSLVTAPSQAIRLRNHCNMRFVSLAFVCWFCAELLGMLLLVSLETSGTPWVKRGLGAMLLLIFFWETANLWASALASVVGRRKSSITKVPSATASADKFDVCQRRNFVWCVAFGLGAGFLRGLFNVPILALIMFSLHSGMSKDEWRGSIAALLVLVTLPKTYVMLFHLHMVTLDHWPKYAVAALSAAMAIPLGNAIASRVDQETFRQFILSILFFGALLMSTYKTGTISVLTIMCLAACFLIGLIVWKCQQAFSGKAEAPSESDLGHSSSAQSSVQQQAQSSDIGDRCLSLYPEVTVGRREEELPQSSQHPTLANLSYRARASSV